MKPEVGQTVYSLNVGNAARNCEQKLTPIVVTKVGRKYFTCGEGWQATRYYIEDWCEKTNYSANTSLYESPKEWEDEKLRAELFIKVKSELGAYGCNRNITLKQIQGIAKILNL